jgi:hypothetical protein
MAPQKHLPPLHTKRPGAADQDWHQARVKGRGAAGEPKKGWGLTHLNNLKNIYYVASALTDITSNYTLPNNRLNRRSSSFVDNDLNKISVN